jgi:hypothetical protein
MREAQRHLVTTLMLCMPSAPRGGEGRCERSATWQRRAWQSASGTSGCMHGARVMPGMPCCHAGHRRTFSVAMPGMRAFGANRRRFRLAGVSTVKLPPLALTGCKYRFPVGIEDGIRIIHYWLSVHYAACSARRIVGQCRSSMEDIE